MSGVHGLSWYPTGPRVIGQILRWAGFSESRLLWTSTDSDERLGRIEIVASKIPGLIAGVRGEAI